MTANYMYGIFIAIKWYCLLIIANTLRFDDKIALRRNKQTT